MGGNRHFGFFDPFRLHSECLAALGICRSSRRSCRQRAMPRKPQPNLRALPSIQLHDAEDLAHPLHLRSRGTRNSASRYLMKDAAERYGYILVSSDNSRNGALKPKPTRPKPSGSTRTSGWPSTTNRLPLPGFPAARAWRPGWPVLQVRPRPAAQRRRLSAGLSTSEGKRLPHICRGGVVGLQLRRNGRVGCEARFVAPSAFFAALGRRA